MGIFSCAQYWCDDVLFVLLSVWLHDLCHSSCIARQLEAIAYLSFGSCDYRRTFLWFRATVLPAAWGRRAHAKERWLHAVGIAIGNWLLVGKLAIRSVCFRRSTRLAFSRSNYLP